METAIRWSAVSSAPPHHFVLVDLLGHKVKLNEVTSDRGEDLEYRQLSQHSKFPEFRAFDWCPSNEALLAIGLPSGTTTVLKIDEDANESFSFPIKNQRYCNAVAFNTQGLLAGGLEKVRNDFCLNIWDVNQRLSSPDTDSGRPQVEPVRKLCTSEAVSSIRFFVDQPDTLIAGVGRQFLRIYDLRDYPGNAAIQFPTRRVNNLAIDPLDQNYFASAGPQGDPTVCIWDRRFTSTSNAVMSPSGTGSAELGQSRPVLEFRNAIDTSNVSASPSIWSLRFARAKKGSLGILSSTGELKVFEISKKSVHLSTGPNRDSSPPGGNFTEEPYVRRIRNVQRPYYDPFRKQEPTSRVVSFDFTFANDAVEGYQCMGLRANGQIQILRLKPPPPPVSFSSQGELFLGRNETPKTNSATPLESNMVSSKGFTVYGLDRSKRFSIVDKFRNINSGPQYSESTPEISNISGGGISKEITAPKYRSSREAHEALYSFTPQIFKMSNPAALYPGTVMRCRCDGGYLFDCEKNQKIVSENPWLQEMWAWIGGMDELAEDKATTYEMMDFSFLGVHAIWHNTLGPNPEARKIPSDGNPHTRYTDAIIALRMQLECPRFEGIKTRYPDHRQVCLAICGWGQSEQRLKTIIQQLVRQGKHTKAAAWALFHNQTNLAVTALTRPTATESHKLLAMGIAAYNNVGGFRRDPNDEAWTTLCRDIADSLDDPYSRAILALVSNGDWKSVIAEMSLPLRDRLGVALKFLNDEELTKFIDSETSNSIRAGDIEGIVLTGLTSQAMDLFQNYIAKYNDVQTAVLAMSYTNPTYVSDWRFWHWREYYRDAINSWKLHIHRVRFDVQSTKKSENWDDGVRIPPPPRQITLRCIHCNGAFAKEDEEADVSATGGSASSAVPAGEQPGELKSYTLGGPGASAGTICPKCGRHLPRCGVCMMWLGTPDVSTPGGAAAVENEDPMTRFLTFCLSCNHGYHSNHARDWFAVHKVCPVADCQCLCAEHR
ncbi:hypothetical protein L228DRAFT_247855 [Xylona heveae TC161]|uniref:WD repeat protein mio zinc-ribbon like domain-containing protein n=1 Tax=Xylona heveae (strain CBS 132557 / TC161) TaxID=1328760 RepID=A0A165GIA0_XYLHT|nr:hypothetical protein L228DRAFT_247855 [Xylona heveae TC161]KZF22216.1 hypothetical protein L228DRAFT_247855 [Xylona heveae TC161]